MDDDFFIGTKESYMALCAAQTAFFAVFIMVTLYLCYGGS